MSNVLLLILAASMPTGNPAKLPPVRVEPVLQQKVEKDVVASMPALAKPPATGCWKETLTELFNVLPASLDKDGQPQAPWRISAAPRNTSAARFQVSLAPDVSTGLLVRIDDTRKQRQRHQSTHALASKESHLDKIELTQDGSLILFYRSVVAGDLDRHLVSMGRPGSDGLAPLSSGPIAFVSISPDARFAFLEAGDLIDLERWTSTTLENLPGGYLSPVAWSCDGSQLIVVAYENWEHPAWASRWLIPLPARRKAR